MCNYKEKPFKVEELHRIILCKTTNMFRDKNYYLGNEKQANSRTPNSHNPTGYSNGGDDGRRVQNTA
uniref:Uncharacterized protein n=1 Tax=Cucumis melo TaxID=3656 RepID=A0A9I9EJK1_CUCME